MTLTPDQIKAFEKASEELVKWLCENCHPHVTVIVDGSGAELLEGLCVAKIEQFFKD